MTDTQLARLADLLAERNQPSPGMLAQRWIAIAGGGVGMIGVFVGLVAWATTLQTSVAAMAAEVSDARKGIELVQATVSELQVDRWTRSDHDRWVGDELRPLEARVRSLEQAAGRR